MEKSKWATCRNTEAHNRLFNEKMEKRFGKRFEKSDGNILPIAFIDGTHYDSSNTALI